MSSYLPSVQSDDGWSDAATESAERVIRGALLKFTDWRWSKGKENETVEDGTTLIALDIAAGWVKWVGGKPVEYRMRQPGRRLPERDELDARDESDWELDRNNEPKDPWQSTRFVYLVDPVMSLSGRRCSTMKFHSDKDRPRIYGVASARKVQTFAQST
jgi:hypothetical protein